MEVKPGFKLTEAGVIPEEWEARTFTDVTDLITCGIAATPEYVPDTQGYPFLSSSNVKDGRILWAQYKHISAALHRRLYRNNPPKFGDVLYSRVGTFGEAAVVDVDFEFSIYVSLTLIKPGKELCSFFLAQLLNSEAYKKKAKDQIYFGGGVGNLNVDVVRRYPIVVPPLPEQHAIATALGDVDGLLGALDRLIAKKRDLKQAAMQQLLTGQTRLPGFSGEWEVKRLGELGTWKGGMTPSMQNPDYWHAGSIPWISSGDVKSILLNQTGSCITALAVKRGTTTMLPVNSIVMVTRSGILRRYLPVAMNVVPMAINQDIKALLPADNLSPAYLLHTLIGHSDQILKRCMKAGTTVESIEFRWLKAFEIPLPPLPEQTAIAEVLSDMDAELAALEQRREKTRALKQSMMQELLTGKTRLL